MLMLSLTGCSYGQSNGVIASIPEASGICYSKTLDSLFVANDEGTVFEISKNGKIVREVYLGNYDLEGIACDDKNQRLLFAIEGKDNILIISLPSLEKKDVISINRRFHGRKILKKDKKHGLEGITIDDEGNIYLLNQSYDFLPEKDPSVMLRVNEKGEILELYDIGFTDMAGITFHNGLFYIVSDDEDLLIIYNLDTKKVVETIKLNSARAQEGICFDNDGYIYIADDKGFVIKKP
jgi:uncharacterized protein YjiK